VFNCVSSQLTRPQSTTLKRKVSVWLLFSTIIITLRLLVDLLYAMPSKRHKKVPSRRQMNGKTELCGRALHVDEEGGGGVRHKHANISGRWSSGQQPPRGSNDNAQKRKIQGGLILSTLQHGERDTVIKERKAKRSYRKVFKRRRAGKRCTYNQFGQLTQIWNS